MKIEDYNKARLLRLNIEQIQEGISCWNQMATPGAFPHEVTAMKQTLGDAHRAALPAAVAILKAKIDELEEEFKLL